MEQDLRDALAQIYTLTATETQKISTQVNELTKKMENISSYVDDKQKTKYLNNEFFELNGADNFVKLKANSFGIGKVLFAFVKFDKITKKKISDMDVYMDMEDALLLANDILSGKLAKEAENERAKGAQYPGPIWKSPMGGVTEEKAKQRGLRTDGKAISRMFTLRPGSRQPFVFTAEQKPGSTNAQGLIIPDSGVRPEVQIRVASSNEDLKKLALAIQSNINAYRAAQYALGAYNVDPQIQKK